jgi:Major Facilitator Superfamily
MFDISLFRVPTFDGGLIAAFCMNGSLFSMLLYLVLYLQDALGYSALQTGLRLLLISGPTLVTATIAGRLSERVPVRWLIGPGLILVGVGLLLMVGLTGSSSWTHLIPGFIISGAGAGFVNPPLASTAIGVVEPERAGMASGVNTTFRQIGIAVSIAALGTIFSSTLRSHLDRFLSTTPQLKDHAGQIVTAIGQGQGGSAFAAVPADLRGPLEHAVKSSFASGINDLLIVTGALALVGSVFSMVLIRSRDFVSRQPAPAPPDGERRPEPRPV